MRKSLQATLTGWPFLLALAVLIVNDAWLKAAYPGALTGKLSDFAGMALLALPLFVMYPRRIWPLSLLLAAGFLYWKSPASNALIAAFNALGWWEAGRTVDYSDMIAVAVLPACHAWLARPARAISPTAARRVLAWPIAALTLGALMGTSGIIPQRQYALRQEAAATVPWSRAQVAELIRSVIEKQGLQCVECAEVTLSAKYERKDRQAMLSYRFNGDREVQFEMRGYYAGMFRDGAARIDEIRDLLKRAFAEKFPGLEYAERLPQRSY